MSIKFHLTCVVQNITGSRLEAMANLCLRPTQYLFGGRQVSFITPQLAISTPIYPPSDRTWVKTALMIALLIPGLLIGVPSKAVAVYLYHNKNHDALAAQSLDLATQSAYERRGNIVFIQDLDTYLFRGWESGGRIEIAKDRIRECLITLSTQLDLSNLHLDSLPPSISTLTQLQRLDCSGNCLTALPDLSHLTQLNYLNCYSNALQALPAGLSRLTQLRHLDCEKNSLRFLPDLSALDRLDTLRCSRNRLSVLPNEILGLPASCHIFADGNLFSMDFIERLRRATTAPGYQGPRHIEYSMGVIRSMDSRSIENILGGFFTLVHVGYTLDNLSSLWADPARQRTLETWLNKLINNNNAPEMQDDAAKQQLARRVLDVFHLAATDTTFKEDNFFHLIEEGLANCIDRTTYYLNHLEASMRLHQTQTAFLFREAWAMHLLYDIAERKLRTLVLNDPIETHLAYHSRLQGHWFPNLVSPIVMRFERCSGVADGDIAAAAEELRRTIHNPDPQSFMNFLLAYHPWTAFLERRYPGERLAALAEYIVDIPTAYDQTYRDTVARTERERARAEKAWISAKTREFLDSSN